MPRSLSEISHMGGTMRHGNKIDRIVDLSAVTRLPHPLFPRKVKVRLEREFPRRSRLDLDLT